MKRFNKIAFALLLVLSLNAVVFAATAFSITETLEKGDSVKGEATLGVDFQTYIDSKSLSNTKPAIKTKVQRKFTLVWVTMADKTQTISSIGKYTSNWAVNSRDNTRIVWENNTSNSSIKAEFGAR